eukprot:3048520-Pleurochrysis_carterae.AAC.1
MRICKHITGEFKSCRRPFRRLFCRVNFTLTPCRPGFFESDNIKIWDAGTGLESDMFTDTGSLDSRVQ